jgi:hypothetical protein
MQIAVQDISQVTYIRAARPGLHEGKGMLAKGKLASSGSSQPPAARA